MGRERRNPMGGIPLLVNISQNTTPLDTANSSFLPGNPLITFPRQIFTLGNQTLRDRVDQAHLLPKSI
jgi:hypothetical protein